MFENVAWAMGAAGADAADGQQNPIVGFLPLIAMFAIFYFLLIRPQQKKAKQHKEMLSALKRGDYVLTAGGLYGRIIEAKDDLLTIELAENLKIKVNRNYVAGLSDSATVKGEGKRD